MHPFCSLCPSVRRLPLLAAPAVLLLMTSLGCRLEDPRYGERAAATAAAISAQATTYAQTVRATATAGAPAVQATATNAAQAALAALPGELQPLYARFGLLFVEIPAGDFYFGKGKTADAPGELIHVERFWIGLTEVTNAQFRPFVEAGGYADAGLWSEAGWQWRSQNHVMQPGCTAAAPEHTPDLALACVSWYEADAYTRWLSRETGLAVRLPTEIEWERAARGDDARRYPWGETAPDAAHANYAGALGGPTLAGAYPAGAGPFGALDLAGNVAEWTSSPTAVDPSAAADRVVRGGSWYDAADSLISAYRFPYALDRQLDTVGIRLVVTLP